MGRFDICKTISGKTMMKIGNICLKEKKENGKFVWSRFSLWANVYIYQNEKYCAVHFTIRDKLVNPDKFIEFMKKKGLDFKIKPKRFVKGYMIAYYEKIYITPKIDDLKKCIDVLMNVRSRKIEIKLTVDRIENILSREIARLL